jgi:AAA+ ATPase superfamily predicted ATPase
MFLGRLYELDQLKKMHMKGGKKLLTLTGAEGSGKTELVNQLMSACRSIYLIPNGYGEKGIVGSFWSQMVASGFGRSAKVPVAFVDILQIIRDESANEGLMLVIDSFQDIVNQSRRFLPAFITWWDSLPPSQNLFVIIVNANPVIPGPAELRSSNSIFSRATERMVLKDLSYGETLPLLSGLTSEEAVSIYSVFGGSPHSLIHFNPRLNLEKNIEENILNRSSYLYNYAKTILLSGVKNRYRVFDILQHLGYGPKTLDELNVETGMTKREIQSELRILESRYAIIRKGSILTDKPLGTRALFSLSDNFTRFWFSFLRPNIDLLERGRLREVMNSVRMGLERHNTITFTGICLQHLHDYIIGPDRNLLYYKWKGENARIDIVALDRETLDAYFVDTHWTQSPLLKDSVESLLSKSAEVTWMHGKRKDHFIIYSKMGFRFESTEAQLVNISTLHRDLSMPHTARLQ